MRKSVFLWAAMCTAGFLVACGPASPPPPPPPECTPATCSAAGKNCGVLPDGCGGELQCGSCPAGQTCGGGGIANVCGTGGVCTPTSCAAAGAACGEISNGCGGTLQCGTCQAGQICGASTPNVCGTPQTPGGTTAWVHTFSAAPVTAVGTDGAAFAAVALNGDPENSVAKVDAGGAVLWTQADRGFYDSATISAANGSAYFAGQAPTTPPFGVLVRYSSSGSARSTVGMGTDLTSFGPLASNAAGDVAWIRVSAGSLTSTATIAIIRAGGAQQTITQSAALPVSFFAVALDDGGNAVAAGQVVQSFTHGGQTVALGPALLKFDRAGTLVWVRSLAGLGGRFYSLGTTHLGTVVALGEFAGNLTWGAQAFAETGGTAAIFVAESDGQPRFFRELPPAASGFRWSLAVDPAGQMVVAAKLEGCAGLVVRRFNLAGDYLWGRTFTSSACDLSSAGVGMLGSKAVLGGGFSGTVDFGKGPVQSSGTGAARDGFLIELGP